ncbi:inner centromere protein A-like isoform X2 [Branchiostoma floridae]|uniref:Inner centromere protein A-like isoform X2 n=1 Tax=Branchiostoma floridae TaxID=7739 RepID=A0A9J7HQH9_BRAFL|nr:inner centromere protein A-like isoform X2 [Branchiostoma floridae]
MPREPSNSTVLTHTLGLRLHKFMTSQLADFNKTFEEEHMTWLNEVLEVAKKSFARKEPELLPKTPSAKNRRRRIRKLPEVEEEEENVEPAAKRRSSASRRSRAMRRSNAHELKAISETELLKATLNIPTQKVEDCKTPPPTHASQSVSFAQPPPPKTTRSTRTRGGNTTESDSEAEVTVIRPTRATRASRQRNLTQSSTGTDTEGEETTEHIPPSKRVKKGSEPELDNAKASGKSGTDTESEESVATNRSTRTKSRLQTESEAGAEMAPGKSGTDTESEVTATATRLTRTKTRLQKKSEDESDKAMASGKSGTDTEGEEVGTTTRSTRTKTRLQKKSESDTAMASSETDTEGEETTTARSTRTKTRLQKGSESESDTQKSPAKKRQANKIKIADKPSEETTESEMSEGDDKPTSESEDVEEMETESVKTRFFPEVRTSPVKPATPGTGFVKDLIKKHEEMIVSSSDDDTPQKQLKKPIAGKLQQKSKTQLAASPAPQQQPMRSTRSKARQFVSAAASKIVEWMGGKDAAETDSATKTDAPVEEEEMMQESVEQDSLEEETAKSDISNTSNRSTRSTRSSRRSSKRQSVRLSCKVATMKRKSSVLPRQKVEVAETVGRMSTRASRSRASHMSSASEDGKDSTMEEIMRPPSRKRTSRSDDSSDGGKTAPAKKRSKLSQSGEPEVVDLSRDSLENSQGSKASLKATSPSLAKSEDNSTEDEEEDIVDKTPSPKCPRSKVIRPRPKQFSFLTSSRSSLMTPGNLNATVTSFIKRNTPVKQMSSEERARQMKMKLAAKKAKEAEIIKKREEEKKQKMEEQKRKREERTKRAAKLREQREKADKEKKLRLEKEYSHRVAETEKIKEERLAEDAAKKKLKLQKRAEAEARRKQEEEARLMKLKEQEEEQRRHRELILRKREHEEAERAARAEELRRQAEERRLELERERQREIELRKQQEEEKERERQRIAEERERERKEREREKELQREAERKAREEAERRAREEAERKKKEEYEKQKERDRQRLAEIMQKERERQERERREVQEAEAKKRAAIMNSSLNTSSASAANTSMNSSLHKPNLNNTFNKEGNPNSYDMTPQQKRTYKAATEENYHIEDLHSDDSTDDEDQPRKKIPRWAQGAPLKAQLINQCYYPPDLSKIFGDIIDTPDLTQVFGVKKSRFNKRTSSAVWNSPLLKT